MAGLEYVSQVICLLVGEWAWEGCPGIWRLTYMDCKIYIQAAIVLNIVT